MAAGLLGTDPPAAAQSVTTFISNTEQPRGITFWVRATAFTTGTSTYTLSSVGVDTQVQTGSVTPVVAIYGDNGGNPGTLLATMTTGPGRIIRSGVATFTAPAGTTLSASTTYWVVTTNSAATDGQGFMVAIINNATLDSGAAAGWSIGSARFKNDITDTSWAHTTFRIRFQIRGTTGSTNNAPAVANVIPDQAATEATPFRYVFPANTFSDPNGDTLSYMATESDNTALPAWLNFAATTRIFSGTPATGDVGTVSVKVTASDGNGGSVSDTFDIEVSAAADTTPPTLSSSVIDSAGLTLHLVFSENLEQSTPPLSSAFTVTADADVVTVSIGTLDPSFPKRIPISVLPAILQGQDVVVTYTDPTIADDANAIQDIAGNDAATFTTGSGGVPVVTNSSTVVAATAPGAPTGLTATASGTTINLSWTAPASTGGSAITGYKIEVSSDDGMTWTDLVADTTSSATTYPHSGLAAGATRHYRVSAINTAGTGGSSGTDSATVGTTATDSATVGTTATAPGAPTGLTATASGTTINLSWTAPASNGGSPITGYKIEVSSDGGSSWTDLVADSTSTATTYPHTGLTAGATRHYRVSAINTAGTGGYSGTDSATVGTTATAPRAPTGLTATASGTTINLSWTAPASNGGSAITGYKIEVSSDGGTIWTDLVADTTSTATTYPHTGLTAGDTRHYRVSAINTAGTGGYSGTDSATVGTTGNGGGGGSGGGGSVGGGGGGGGGGGPSPSDVDFEWSVTRDIDDLGIGHDTPSGLWSDGTTLWILENGSGAGDAVYAYDLATGARLEAREFELADANRAPRGISSDRVTVWVSDSGQERLFAYDLASGERVEAREIVLDEDNGDARGLWSDDETIWVLDGGQEVAIYLYDLASGELIARYALDDASDDPHGIWSDGVTVWVSDHNAKRLSAYRLEDGELVRNSGEEFTELSGASNNNPRGIWSDGAVMYVADESDARIYTYNMPDAIDARLASLTLSGVEIGEFSPAQTEYEGVADDGVTETTVEAEAAQSGASLAIDPADADAAAAGRQVALEDLAEITVTVTAADGSRTRVYRVGFGAPEQAATSEPGSGCFRGDVAVGFSLVVYDGGSVEDLDACAESRNVAAVYALDGGEYLSYVLGAPGLVNDRFGELYAGGVPALTPLIASSDGPATAAPTPVASAVTGPWAACLRGEIVEGFNLVLYEGGSVGDLDACAEEAGLASLYILDDGVWVSYILGAPEFVNRSFRDLFADGLPVAAPLVGKRD